LEGSVRYEFIRTEKKFIAFLSQLKKKKEFCFDIETDSLNAIEARVLGIGFSWKKGEAFYVDNNEGWLKKLAPVFADSKIKKIGQNIKFDIEGLLNEGIEVRGEIFDTMVASYLISPGTRNHGLDAQVFSEFGYQMQPIEDLIGKRGKDQKSLAEIAPERISDYCCEDADFTYRLVAPLTKKLKETNNLGLFENIEMPLIYTLIEMEKNGVKVDTDFLKNMSKDLLKKIEGLEKKIFSIAGEKFNVASPTQLKEILFDTLKIPTKGLGKTKTGISSAAAELEKLKNEHEIIPLIMDHREFSKLQSTYTDAIPKLVNKKTGRVHTNFNQTITATGRLSSSHPNLQNIPIRTEVGQQIRNAFVAEKGRALMAADYSQIELRIIASLANDKSMISGFQAGEDIHKRTAAEIHNVSQDKVTKQMRRAAKAINFGIIYGMGAYGLAMREGISNKEAKEFIEKYFTLHKDIKKYLEKTKELAREHGYVETLFGRRRYLPEIHSGMHQVKAAAERMAINHPVQGTAADIMKLAMIEILKKLPKVSKDTKMVLQVHDELVFEVPKGEEKKVAKFLKQEMEHVYSLRVPIEVHVETGRSWGEMEKIKF